MVRAFWNNALIAESDDTIVVEGDHYFPPEHVDSDHLLPSQTTTVCPRRGEACYWHVTVDGELNADAAWAYADPEPGVERIRNRIAFWRGVEVET